MRDIIGKYNRNRKIIWFIIGLIIAIISLIHIINNGLEDEQLVFQNNGNKVITEQFYDTSYSVISSQSLDTTTSNKVTDVIKQFINYCNEGNIEMAYNMLSLDCKNVLYPTLEEFQNNYYAINFENRKTYNLQSWITYDNKYTYMVELKEDILSTGNVSNIKKQDYYTVIEENDKYYLNISGFIEKNIINSFNEKDSLQIIVKSEEIFVDYLNLDITVNNQTKNNVLLDSGENAHSVYVTDSENIKYVSYLYESSNSDLLVRAKSSKDFNIKFMKSYRQTRPIITANFEDIILNYEKDNLKNLSIIVEL